MTRFAGKSLGPGIVFALTVIGAGDIVSNAAAGADYGYSLIWALAVTLVFRYVWVGTAAKYVLVTEESLLQGYDRIGRWVSQFLLGAILFLRHVSNLYKVVLLGTVANLFLPLSPKYGPPVWSLILTTLGFSMMFWGGYPVIERFFKLLMVLLGGALVLGAFLSQPDFPALLRGALIPSFPGHEGLYDIALLLMALVGTEAGSMTNVTYTYFMHEKGWKDRTDLSRQRFDLAFSVSCMFAMGALVQIAAAGTLGRDGVSLATTSDLLRLLGEGHGAVIPVVFGLGLLAAVFTGFVGGTTGYALIATDIVRNVLPGRGHTGPAERSAYLRDPVYRACVALWSFSPIYILTIDVQPIWLLIAASAFSVLAIPFLAFFLLKITSDRTLLGRYVNRWHTNLILTLLGLVSVYFCIERAVSWFSK
jgi:Mn2+/Fe2+ NRAMP family transporter